MQERPRRGCCENRIRFHREFIESSSGERCPPRKPGRPYKKVLFVEKSRSDSLILWDEPRRRKSGLRLTLSNAERINGKPPASEGFPFKGQGGVVGGEVIDGRR